MKKIEPILVYDRKNKVTFEEEVYGQSALEWLYGDTFKTKWFGPVLRFLVTKFSWFSRAYGIFQKKHRSKKKILPFITRFGIDEGEFLDPTDSFQSFNEFFIRKLKPECRPIGAAPVVAPAEGRYLAYAKFRGLNGIFVKGKTFSLYNLIGGNSRVAEQFANGPFLIARLCPTDYHRIHMPVMGIPSNPKRMNGKYDSVNPMALKKRISILHENKRVGFLITTEHIGDVLMVLVGATNVASIQMHYEPQTSYEKGAEIGYFSFGGSTALLFFEPGRIVIDPEILYNTSRGLETLIRVGESLIT